MTQNIIKVDGRYLRTLTGIPQGSVLSVLLCGLFYAHLENHLLRPLVPLGLTEDEAGHVDVPAGKDRRTAVGENRRPSGEVPGVVAGSAAAAAAGGAERGGGTKRRRESESRPRSSIGSSSGSGPEPSCSGSSSQGSQKLRVPAELLAAAENSPEPLGQFETQELPSSPPLVYDSADDSDADSDATVELDGSDLELNLDIPNPMADDDAPLSSSGGGNASKAAAAALPTPDAPQTPTQHSLLLRLVDDFLYISTDLSAARRFVATLHGKIPDYGCTVHAAKTQISFEMGADVSGDLAMLRPTLGTFIPWCGLLLNTTTLEVQADYSRYLGKDFRLRDSFTVEASNAVGSTLRRRLYSFLRPKCHGVLLDTRMNSVTVVWLNIYQSFLLAAIKFHSYTRALPQRHFNVHFFTRCVLHAVQAMRCLIRRRVSTVSAECAVTATEVHWLGLKAFNIILRRKHRFYKPLLPVLDRLLSRPAYTALNGRLGHITEPSRSPDFQKMIY